MNERLIHERDFFTLQAVAEWAEAQGSQGTANVLRDICARAVRLEDNLEHRVFPEAPRPKF
jgi:hypothetical protein